MDHIQQWGVCPAGRDIPSSEQAAVRGDLGEFVVVVLHSACTGRKPALTDAQACQPRERAAADESKSLLAKEFSISREIVYSYLRADTVMGCWQAETDPAARRERRW